MRTSYPGIATSEMGVTGLKEYNENTDPTRPFQSQLATPSPSIAERAKCFGSIRTGNSSTTKMACPANSPANSMTSVLTESEPLYPANIVASRRILFSPARNSYANSNPRPIQETTAHQKRNVLATIDKENAGDDKATRLNDVPSDILKEACSSIAAPTSKANDSPSKIADKQNEFEPKGLVEKRALWLQGRTISSSSVAFPGRERSVDGSTREESSVNNCTVASRTTLLQKNLASNTTSKQATVSLNCTGLAIVNGKQALQQQSSSATIRGTPRFDNRAQDTKKSPSTSPKPLEVQAPNRDIKKAKRPKSLVETRAKWLEKQVNKNELCHDVPSDDEDEVEKPKTDIQLRLEALQKEMMAAQQYVADGVAPKRCLAELP